MLEAQFSQPIWLMTVILWGFLCTCMQGFWIFALEIRTGKNEDIIFSGLPFVQIFLAGPGVIYGFAKLARLTRRRMDSLITSLTGLAKHVTDEKHYFNDNL